MGFAVCFEQSSLLLFPQFGHECYVGIILAVHPSSSLVPEVARTATCPLAGLSGLARTEVVAIRTGTSLALSLCGCAWKGRVGTRPLNPGRRDVFSDDHSFCHAALRSRRLHDSPMEALCRSPCLRSWQ